MGFKRFEEAFRVTAKEPEDPEGSFPLTEIDELFENYGGFEFENGLYRVHSKAMLEGWREKLGRAFPDESRQVTPFGQDWQGNQFGWRGGKNPTVLLFQIVSGEAYEIADSLEVAHEEEFVEHAQEALSIGQWRDWRVSGGAGPTASQCVGYRVPLFLGGKDEVANLELCDINVYWEITAQLLHRTRNLPLGTRISDVRLT